MLTSLASHTQSCFELVDQARYRREGGRIAVDYSVGFTTDKDKDLGMVYFYLRVDSLEGGAHGSS